MSLKGVYSILLPILVYSSVYSVQFEHFPASTDVQYRGVHTHNVYNVLYVYYTYSTQCGEGGDVLQGGEEWRCSGLDRLAW